jgi:hypothetical protein
MLRSAFPGIESDFREQQDCQKRETFAALRRLICGFIA